MSKKNLRAQIFAAQDLKSEVVQVDEWDTSILMKALGVAPYGKLLKECLIQGERPEDAKTDTDKLALLLVLECSHDPETKEKIFSPADLDALGEKAGTAINKLSVVAFRLCGGNQEEAEKNSDATLTEGSASGSQQS